MSLSEQLTEKLRVSGILEQMIKVGETIPGFSLPDAHGILRSSEELLKDGPLVTTFYRVGWCPYCNLELRAYQALLPQFNVLGAKLVAISPELADESLSTQEKNELQFTVLSDINAAYADKLGLNFVLPDSLKPIYAKFGIDIEKHNGAGQFTLPIPATLIVNKQGLVEYIFADVDYTQRIEPNEILDILTTL